MGWIALWVRFFWHHFVLCKQRKCFEQSILTFVKVENEPIYFTALTVSRRDLTDKELELENAEKRRDYIHEKLILQHKVGLLVSVLRIQLILMRIRILDPHWKKWIRIRIQDISLKFTEFFLTKQNFKIFGLISFACPLNPDPWIRIFLQIRIQEAKILRIQRIRILSTELTLFRFFYLESWYYLNLQPCEPSY